MKFTDVQTNLAEACMTLSSICTLFCKFYQYTGFWGGKQNSQVVRVYFMAYTDMHSALHGEGLECREGYQCMDSVSTSHQMEEGDL